MHKSRIQFLSSLLGLLLLVPTARAGDGIIEAFESPEYPFLLGIQWHPEKDLNHPVYSTVMEKFLEASSVHVNTSAT